MVDTPVDLTERFRCTKIRATLTRASCAARHKMEVNEKSSEADRGCTHCSTGYLHSNGEVDTTVEVATVVRFVPPSKGQTASFLVGPPPPVSRPKDRRPAHVVPAWVRPAEAATEVVEAVQPEFWGAIEPSPMNPVMTTTHHEEEIEPATVTLSEWVDETHERLQSSEGLAAWVPAEVPAGTFGLDRTPTIQSRARQESIEQITFDGRTQSVDEWAAEYGVHRQTIIIRARQGKPLNKRTYQIFGYNPEVLPIQWDGREQTAEAWAKELGVHRQTILDRHRRGKPLNKRVYTPQWKFGDPIRPEYATLPEAPTTAEEPQMPVTTPTEPKLAEQTPVSRNEAPDFTPLAGLPIETVQQVLTALGWKVITESALGVTFYRLVRREE